MAEKKYLNDVGLERVADHVKSRLKTVTTMPASAQNGAVRLYVGETDENYTKGHIYEYTIGSGFIGWADITDNGGSITVDDELSTTSKNPVENKVITNEINKHEEEISGEEILLKNTVGFITKNIFDVNKSNIGDYINRGQWGPPDNKFALNKINCKDKTSYIISVDGENIFKNIRVQFGYNEAQLIDQFPYELYVDYGTSQYVPHYVQIEFEKESDDITLDDIVNLKLMVREASIVNKTYHQYDGELSVNDLLNQIHKYGAWNVFDSTKYKCATEEGVEITNVDGGIRIKNTTNSNIYVKYEFINILKQNTDYVFISDVDITSGEFNVTFYSYDPNSNIGYTSYRSDNIITNTYVEVYNNTSTHEGTMVSIAIKPNSDITFSNMYMSLISCKEYQPYAMTNEELTKIIKENIGDTIKGKRGIIGDSIPQNYTNISSDIRLKKKNKNEKIVIFENLPKVYNNGNISVTMNALTEYTDDNSKYVNGDYFIRGMSVILPGGGYETTETGSNQFDLTKSENYKKEIIWQTDEIREEIEPGVLAMMPGLNISFTLTYDPDENNIYISNGDFQGTNDEFVNYASNGIEISYTYNQEIIAEGTGSLAQGIGVVAKGNGTHAEGLGTKASHDYQHVSGKYNNNKSNTLFEIGNGSAADARSNAFEVYQNGDVNFTGSLKKNGVSVLDEWTEEIILDIGDTSAEFENLNTDYSYDVYFECADGYAPPMLTSGLIFDNDTATATFSAVTEDQAGGENGTDCKISLRIVK